MRCCVVLAALLVIALCADETVKHGVPGHKQRDAEHYQGGEHDDRFDHEAVLGTEADAFSKLSPEEAKKRLAELVKVMDENSDGFITKDELKDWIKKSFENINMEEAEEKLHSDDENKDGKLTWDEYLNAIYGMSESDLKTYKEADMDDPEAKKMMEQSLSYDKKKFEAADANGDGALTLPEYAAFMHPYDYDSMSVVEAERVMMEYDSNSDGTVSMNEYLDNPQFKDRDREDMLAEEENFKYTDTNRDGELDASEVLKWVSPNMEEVTTEEAEHLIAETDSNGDGKLSSDEILAQHELWVGSEATDYGNMLLDKDEL